MMGQPVTDDGVTIDSNNEDVPATDSGPAIAHSHSPRSTVVVVDGSMRRSSA
jgi:hypothetical protein